ncbi:MAG: sugar phosphate isomerase/epimerase [Cyclobacteriaceae bacterium]|nr:sugar phosphate isomerase/epimerase [Cyclobacteriaceae bacterium]
MNSYNRREFLKAASVLSVGSFGLSFSLRKKYKPLLAFSSLGCPDWSLKTMVDFAVKHGYQGLELRGLLRELDLPKCPEFSTAQQISASKKLVTEKGLKFVNLGSSANLHLSVGVERTKQIDDAKRFIDLAAQLDCPYIRVFPNNFPKDQAHQQTMELISTGLLELGNYAKGGAVKVLLETHGDVVYTADIEAIMKAAAHPQVGLIWDILNMWTITKESPVIVYKKLKPYIEHTHIKNATLTDGKINYVLLQEGEVPIFDAIDLLVKDSYRGYFSFEWEKLWHPEIAEPEIALADYPLAMKKYFESRK